MDRHWNHFRVSPRLCVVYAHGRRQSHDRAKHLAILRTVDSSTTTLRTGLFPTAGYLVSCLLLLLLL